MYVGLYLYTIPSLEKYYPFIGICTYIDTSTENVETEEYGAAGSRIEKAGTKYFFIVDSVLF
jgi:hypothetical protein